MHYIVWRLIFINFYYVNNIIYLILLLHIEYHFSDFDEGNQAFINSIAVINSLDLVITADTALAHLSATLGKKTWIALPFIADWRWFKDKKNTKWYNNVVLYRQEKNEDWDSVFGNIKKDIVELLNF